MTEQATAPKPPQSDRSTWEPEEVDELDKGYMPPNLGEQISTADPFGDTPDKQVPLDKPVKLGQLQAELEEALGVEVHLATSGSTLGEEISKSNKAVLHIVPEDADTRKVNKAVKDHVPDPHWGQVERRSHDQLVQALADGETLDLEDLNAVVRGLLSK